MSRRPAPIKSDLTTGPSAVIAPPVNRPPKASIAVNASIRGNAGKNSGAAEKKRVVKVTARIDEALAGRCRAAFLDAVLDGGPTSFEGWVADAMAAALARAEKRRGRAYEPVGADRIPKGRRN